MEFFHNVNIDFLGKKWYFLAFSLIFSVAGVMSMLFWHHIPWGVDFRGGTLVYVKFAHKPDLQKIRTDLDRAGLKDPKLQPYDRPSLDEVLVDLDVRETSEKALDEGKQKIIQALETNVPAGAQCGASTPLACDLNNASALTIKNYLMDKDPMHLGTDADTKYSAQTQAILNYRNNVLGWVFRSFDELKGAPGVDPAVAAVIPQGFFLSDFGVFKVEIIGPQVGSQLRTQAGLATLYSLLGMLVYLGFRFEWIYGVAAVITVFHDTLITVGAFSLTNTEISLTVIAAILTLIGYSNNDTIVVFDRIRENIKLMRREKLSEIVNRSINQTLSRTILTAGLTFLTVLALFLFGGEVLRGFSLALVIGILIGTYSSIAIAAPILVAYQDWRVQKGKRPVAMPGKAR
ncbi:MAG TPA: protein translocase subunit SecF [Candidatus Sulfotelmatobacter sp.]|nr:protein translocase subunit SecF [Candidatus Sulfotelmatobacter sp.]